MCSLSWFYRNDGYEVFFNRDEKKTRGPAFPPAQTNQDGVRMLCPRDADAGGTWLLSNEYGVTLALLNYWNSELQHRPVSKSRGRLLTDTLGSHQSAEDAMLHLESISLEDYASFTLAAFDQTLANKPIILRWDGFKLEKLLAQMPICSSSYLPEEVISARQRSFALLITGDASTLWDWHRFEDTPSAYTVRMNRPDAQTWSISRVSVTSDVIRWVYIEEMPNFSAPSLEHLEVLKR